jgi:Transcription factor Tfb4
MLYVSQLLAGRVLIVELVINRLAHPPSGSVTDETTSASPRVLILSVSPDLSASYIPVMNSIFSAQKLVCIDGFDDVAEATECPMTIRKLPSTFAKFSGRKRYSFSKLHT